MIRLELDEAAAPFEAELRELCKAFFPGEDFEIHTPEGVHFSERTGEESLLRLSLNVPGASLSLCGSRKRDKSILKAWLYQKLSKLCQRELPWGDLTGIRPVSLASQRLSRAERILARRLTERELKELSEELRSEYLLSEEKLRLMMEIAGRESRTLDRIWEKTGRSFREGFSLYVGIPFCPTRCLYCSFLSNPISLWEKRIGDYLDCLRREIRAAMEEMSAQGKHLQTVYVGGGTPTALPERWLSVLMEILREECFCHPMTELCEFTVEAGRPDSLNREKLRILKDAGADRISVNPQSFRQETLDLIGRRHTAEDVRSAFSMARDAGFSDINMDLIMGLPGEGLSEVTETLSETARLAPDSLTVHSLAVKRAARLREEKPLWDQVYRAGSDSTLYRESLSERERNPLCSFPEGEGLSRKLCLMSEMERMMKAAEYTASLLGLRPYYLYRQKNMAGNLENVGYAEPGKECLYNILMMEEKHTVIGCGAGSATKRIFPDGRRERCDNGKDIKYYFEKLPELIERKRRLLRDEEAEGR